MMLVKLSLGNIRKSLRDYAICFFTLVIGVSVFYVFNAVGEQAAMLEVTKSRGDVIELLTTMLSGVSVFVACVLGLLIVYASRFLMKRRNKEFALYMMLGMGKGRISAILLLETVFVGIFSLAAGLAVGLGLSQLMSALVANLFEADMTAWRFLVSGEAILKTVLYFAAMYVVVILFQSMGISRMKLIDLLQSEKKSEQVRLKNPVLCIFLFLMAAAALGYAYYQVGWNFTNLNNRKLAAYIATGAVATFLIFWSVSGMLLRMVMGRRRLYYRGLNAFTFRQISSKVNTMVFSMTVICLMLFVTICTLSASFTVRNTMNANLRTLCPADFEIWYHAYEDGDGTESGYGDVTDLYSNYGYDLTEHFREYVHFHSYVDETFTFGAFLGDQKESVSAQVPMLQYDTPFELYRLSDYNALMRLYGREELELDDDEFILLCTFNSAKNILDGILETGFSVHVLGNELHSRYAECQNGFIELSSQNINTGIFVVPDGVVRDGDAESDYLIGNYDASTKEERTAMEAEVRGKTEEIREFYRSDGASGLDGDSGSDHSDYSLLLNTRMDISEATIGLTAMITFLGLYTGLIFLIACGAILALKELSESVDSIRRYEILRKIGVDERDIGNSLFRQTGLFFLFPLILACVHSIFGIRFAVQFLEVFGMEKIWESIAATLVIILLIYGGYFLVTLYSSRQIIKEK